MPINKPSASQEYQDYIVNLSTIHKLKSISEVLDQFADLHYKYAQSWLGKWYSKIWVSLKYFSMSNSINDYKLGKIDTVTFINKLQEIFYFIPAGKNPKELLEKAWNSLIIWDEQSTQRLHYLIAKDQSVYLISNTNELNIQKIKRDIGTATGKEWHWQEEIKGECKFQVCEKFILMTSYDNGVFKTDGLIEKLVKQLLIERKIHENIILVSQYQPDLDKAKELGIHSKQADQFFPPLSALNLASSESLNNTTSATTSPNRIQFQSNNLLNVSRPLFVSVPQHENLAATTSENTPLLLNKK